MKYHALFIIFDKAAKFEIDMHLQQIIGGALWGNGRDLIFQTDKHEQTRTTPN